MPKSKMPKVRWPSDGVHLLEVYEARDGWRWRLWARNGRLVAESGEAYTSKTRCRVTAQNLFSLPTNYRSMVTEE
jgi:uncharacterized protein YegP (UPF0339 family)